MRNDYKVCNDHLEIFLERKDGSKLITKVNKHHLEFLQSVPYRFYASWDTRTKSFYVLYHTTNDEGKETVKSLHRLITNCPKEMVVDHWDKDTLNNLDSNLNIVSQSKNMQNRNSVHPRNKTGYKGVSYCKRTGKYIAQIRINKKHFWLGRHETAEEAHKAYMDFRNKTNIYVNTEVM